MEIKMKHSLYYKQVSIQNNNIQNINVLKIHMYMEKFLFFNLILFNY